MNKKSKDSVFAVFLILLGAYVVYEGMNIVNRASKPPFNISSFSISPGMMPVILGAALVVFSFLLLVVTLRGEKRPLSSLASHLKVTSLRFGQAVGEIDVLRMIGSMALMFVFTFFIVGNVRFWLGACLFLVVLMLYLRASKPWVVLIASCVSVALIVLLFEGFFSTSLP